MQKIYRILRDNKEKGPFTIEELVQFSLKPYDLIWVDGRSAGWRYPSEIEALKSYLPGQESAEKNQLTNNQQAYPAPKTEGPIADNSLKRVIPVEDSYLTPASLEEDLTSEKLER